MAVPNTSVLHSATGTRGFVRIGYYLPPARFSAVSISVPGLQTGYPQNQDRTWWIANDFDRPFDSNKLYVLPCDDATFTLGTDLYTGAEDAVPGAMRMKPKRSDYYTYNLNFPIILSDNLQADAAYVELFKLIKKATTMLCINTSLQTDMFKSVLSSFSITAEGYGGANPINCILETRGITADTVKINKWSGFTRSILSIDGPNYDLRDKGQAYLNTTGVVNATSLNTVGNYPSSTTQKYSGRFANIKDCRLSFDGVNYPQIIKMSLKIDQEITPVATSGMSADYTFDPPIKLLADRLYVVERKVTGEFTFLSSAVTQQWGMNPGGTPNVNLTEKYALAAQRQWATPLVMKFSDKMVFEMQAVYWQPHVEQLSTGSPLVTIKFIARSDVKGISEFDEGLNSQVPL